MTDEYNYEAITLRTSVTILIIDRTSFWSHILPHINGMAGSRQDDDAIIIITTSTKLYKHPCNHNLRQKLHKV